MKRTEPPSHSATHRLFPPLHAIVDVECADRIRWAAIDVARACFDGGARLVQIRAKRLGSGPLLALAEAVVALARTYHASVIVNDRVDVARLSGAAGVHVGQDDLPPAEARHLLGPDAIVGYSTHSIAQVIAAAEQPISYIAVGPVFGTRTKDTGYSAVGLDLVSEAVDRAHGRPVVAIGGITLDTAPAVLAAGATSVAVISDLLVGHNPVARVRAYVESLGQ